MAQHETFLVGPDGRADHLRGDFQKALVERAHQHHRPFHQPGDLFEQALVLDQFEPLREGEVLRVVQDDVLAAIGIEHDAGALQRGRVIVEAADLDGAGAMKRWPWVMSPEAMSSIAKRTISGSSVSGPKVHTMDFSGRTQRRAPGSVGGGARAHGFRPWESADDGGQDFGQHVLRRPAGALDQCHVELALLRIGDDRRLVQRG